ncbi:MAG: hypothetical protein R3E96_08300 [Planctomycetota bacterium]
MQGLDVEDKAERTRRFHDDTVHSLMELLGAAGLDSSQQLTPHHIMRRTADGQVKTYFELYPFIERGALIAEPVPEAYEDAWRRASATHFGSAPQDRTGPAEAHLRSR